MLIKNKLNYLNAKLKDFNQIYHDSKGIVTIEYIFLILFMAIIAISMMHIFQNLFNSIDDIEENVEGRKLLNSILSIINNLNSLNEGYEKEINLPEQIANNSYSIKINSDCIILETKNKKGMSMIFPINLVDSNNHTINERIIYSGEKYIFKKVKNENNLDSIYIYNIISNN
ncbi:MAG: hypothetical protein LBM96_13170 [Methanobrevibacter sp.]|jgi:hypothetical protein|nr:hypothetical protein [Candidatus Methanoflexus mossambicus]